MGLEIILHSMCFSFRVLPSRQAYTFVWARTSTTFAVPRINVKYWGAGKNGLAYLGIKLGMTHAESITI